jgi:hypothetical protein
MPFGGKNRQRRNVKMGNMRKKRKKEERYEDFEL